MKQFLLPLITISVMSYGQQINFDTLKTSALEHSSRLKLRSIDTSIETARLESVYSTLYPQLSLGYSGEYSKNLDNAASGSIQVGDTTINSTTLYKNSASLRLNYELYHFGTTLKQIEVSKKEIAVKKLEQCNETIKLDTELLDQYVKGQKAFTTSDYKSRMLLLRKELYVLKQRLYNAGKESRISIGDEAIRIIDIEHEIEKANMDYAESLIVLSKLSFVPLNPDDTQLLSLTTTTHMSNTIPFTQTPQSQQYQEKLTQKYAEIAINTRSQLPTISLYSNYYLYGSDRAGFTDAMDATRPNSWNAGLSLRWSLFEGFKYNSESQRLKLELQRIREESDLAKREFDYDTQIKQDHLSRLEQLTKNETEALNETNTKIMMTKRLRDHGETDAVSEVSVKLEGLERELTLTIESIQQAYEAKALQLQHTKADQCTQL